MPAWADIKMLSSNDYPLKRCTQKKNAEPASKVTKSAISKLRDWRVSQKHTHLKDQSPKQTFNQWLSLIKKQ